MSPLSLKRLFAGKGKSQLQLSALCIGEYSRLTEQIPADHNYHELESLLAPERGQGEGPVGPASQASPVPKSSGLGSAQSFRGLQSFKHLLQHLGGASREGGPAPQAEGEAQQQLAQFVKQLGGGASEVSFVTAAEDGLLSRERVLAKLTKLFKQSAAPVVLVAYSGPSDERGNWCFAGQASASGASGSASAAGSLPYPGSHGAPGSPTTGGGAVGSSVSSCVVSFREVSMLWQRHRKHSQRLVLLLDCANSGYWVSALRLLSKAEQLELSLGVQASDCSAPAVADRQLTYMPGIFTQLFLSNNKWRRAPRPSAAAEHPHPHPGQGQDQPQAAGAATGPAGGGNGGGGGGGRAAERWLPGMLPSYYATWLNDSLVDYGIALRFFNCNVLAAASHTRASLVTEPSSPVTLASGGARRASSIIMMAAAEGAAGLARPSRQGDAALTAVKAAPHSATDGGVEGVWSPFRHADTDHLEQQQQREQRRGGAGTGAGGEAGSGSGLLNAAGELVGPADSPEGADRDASRAAMSMRAVSVPDAARRRFSSLADYYVSSSGSGSGTGTSAAAGVAAAANSPIHSAHNQLHGSATTTGIVASYPSQQPQRPPGADVRAASSGSGIGYIMLQRLLGSPSKSQSQVNARSGGSGGGGDGAGGGAPSEPGVGQLHPGQLGMPQQDLMADSPGHSTSMHGAALPGEQLVHMSFPASAEAGGAGAGAGMAAGRPLQRRAASGDAAHVGVAAAAPRFGADSMPHILESEPADARGDGGGVGGAGGVRQQPAQAWTEQQQQQQPRARSGAAGAAEAGQGYALGAAADAARRAGAAVRPWEVEIEVEAEDAEDAEAGGYEAGGGAAAVTGASGVDSGVGLAVQASARSDTAAVAWGRRSTRADRDLLLAELDQRNAGSTASFTAGGVGGAVGGGGGGGGGGFVNQLYGALHEVATEQRLWGRRAPLEGDESMGDMMRDVELDRRASNASLPSFMLPRAELLSTGTHGAVAVAGGGAAGGAGSAGAEDAERGAATVLAIPLSSTNITATLAAGGAGAGKAGTRAPVATPRMSGLGALGAAGAGGVGSGSSGGGPALSGRPSINTPRQASRLFMTSLANVHAAAGGHDGGGGGNASSLASGLLMTDPEMELAMEAAAAAAAGGTDRFELMSGNVPAATDPAALSALVAAAIGGSARPGVQTSAAVEGMLRQMQETQAAAGGGLNDAGGASLGVQGSSNDDGSSGLSGGGGGGGFLFDAAMHILMKQAEALVSALPEEMAELAALASPAGAGGAGAGSGRARPGTPSALAVDSPQPCASPTLSPMTSGIERRRMRASGAGVLQSRDSGPLGLGPAPAASVMLRSLLKQHVSIADSMELDSVLGGSPSAVGGGGGGGGGGRRAGRFEMAGSESSSFVFGDDRDRFEVLRMMRDYQGDLADDGGGGGDTDTDMGGGDDDGGGGGSDCPMPPNRNRARRGGDEDGGGGGDGDEGGDGEEGGEEEDDQCEDEDDAAAADAESFRQAAAEARAAAAAALAAEEGQGQGPPHGSGPPPPSNRGGEMRVYGCLGAAAVGQGEEQQQQQQQHGDGGMAVGVREAAAQVAAVAAMLQGDESAQYGYTGESGSLLTADMEAAALSEGPPAP